MFLNFLLYHSESASSCDTELNMNILIQVLLLQFSEVVLQLNASFF